MVKKSIKYVLLFGVVLTLLSGFIENNPPMGIPENKFFGYPLSWRVEVFSGPQKFLIPDLLIDLVFWMALFASIILLIERYWA